MKWLRWGLLPLAVGLLALSFWVKTPLVFSFEPWTSIGLLISALGLVLLSVSELVWDKREHLWVRVLLFVVAVGIAGVVTVRHVVFMQIKREVLEAMEPARLRPFDYAQGYGEVKFGEHFIVGYTDPEEMKMLIRAGVGGVFVGGRNAKGKTLSELREEIASFQKIRNDMQLPPLFIATDWEGGVVQKLSPPLMRLRSLREVADEGAQNWSAAVKTYAATQAGELKQLGVNVNFAPVVDIDPGNAYKGDKYTKISRRAISDDAEKVASVAAVYSRGLLSGGVLPTLKHFPGLRLAAGDTHLGPVNVDVGVNELDRVDWLPFRKLLSNCHSERSEESDTYRGSTDPSAMPQDDRVKLQDDNKCPWLMLSHVIVPEIDSVPVSYSGTALKLIREQWGFDGIAVTDDWSMGAIYNSKEGPGKAAVVGLNRGVDIILVAFDPEIYYQVMRELLVADQKNEIDRDELRQSEQRIEKARGIVERHVGQ